MQASGGANAYRPLIPVLPPYYSLRVLPFAVPNIDAWKRRVFRERDIF